MLEKSGSDKAPMTVCLMGASMQTGNKGVSALAASLVTIIKSLKPEARISFFIGSRFPETQDVQLPHKIVKVDVVNYRLSLRARLNEHLFWIFFLACAQRLVPLKAIRERIIKSNIFLSAMYHSDFVGDIKGGDSFSDIYGIKRLIIGLMPTIVALLLKKRLVLLPQTYGPYHSRISRMIARLIINRASYICSRERSGIGFVDRLTAKPFQKGAVRFCPDVAFLLHPVKPKLLEIDSLRSPALGRPLIGFNINGLMYNGGYNRENMFNLKVDYRELIFHILERILGTTDAHILLLPHTFGPPGNINSDPDACNDVFQSINDAFEERVHLLMREYNQSEIKGIIGFCDFFIGSRMHSCIAALSQGIPTVGIAYSKKFLGVFDSVGFGDMVLDARFTDEESIIDAIVRFFHERSRIAIDIKVKVDVAQKRIRGVFEELVG